MSYSDIACYAPFSAFFINEPSCSGSFGIVQVTVCCGRTCCLKIRKYFIFRNDIAVIVNESYMNMRFKRQACFIGFCLFIHEVSNESNTTLFTCTAAERKSDFAAVFFQPLVYFINGTLCNGFTARSRTHYICKCGRTDNAFFNG